ncbi:Hsp70 suppressor, GTPase facilitates ribosomal subunit dissociation, partial [Tulasnella sp. 427]
TKPGDGPSLPAPSKPSLASLAPKTATGPKPSLASLAASKATATSKAAPSLASLAAPASNPSRSTASTSSTAPAAAKPSLAALAAARATQNVAALGTSGKLASLAQTAVPKAPTGNSPHPQGPKPLSKLALKAQMARTESPSLSPRNDVALANSDPKVNPSTHAAMDVDEGIETEEVDPFFTVMSDSANTTSHTDPFATWIKQEPTAFGSLLLITEHRSADAPSNLGINTLSLDEKSARVPRASVAFDFNTPSPDDLVLNKREGTRLAAEQKAAKLQQQQKAVPGAATPKKSVVISSAAPSGRNTPTATPKKTVPGAAAAGPSASPTKSKKAAPAPSGSASAGPSRTAPQSQLQSDMAGLNLEQEDDQPVEETLPPPKMALSKEKVLEEARKALDGKNGDGKKGLSLVIIGHVDAGKSTLMGRLTYELGQMEEKKRRENERDSNKAGKGSFSWAWEMDALGEERDRGVTIDINQATLNLPNTTLTILDAPGHRDFVPNMISGASQADAALLVVDATTGEFEAGFAGGGQSREHVLLVRSLGVGTIVIAVNKLDMVNYSQDRFEEISSTLKPFLVQSGFSPSKTTFVPVAGMTGVNLADKNAEGSEALKKWWDGQTLVEAL